MAKVSISTLKNWFKTGLKPTQEQFWNWMDSYWHKDQTITQDKIENLADTLAGKAAANHTHADYIKTDASNLDEGSKSALKTALEIETIDDSKSELTEQYPDLGLETGSKQSDYNNAVANKLETQQSSIDNKITKPEEEGTTEDYPFVVLVDEDGLASKIPFDEFLKINNLLDMPNDFSGAAGKFLAVKATADGIEYRTISRTDLGLPATSADFSARVPYWNYTTGVYGNYPASSTNDGATFVVRRGDGTVRVSNAAVSNDAVAFGQANLLYVPFDILAAKIINTNGNPLSIQGLPDKAADATFQDILGINSTGQLAKIGHPAFKRQVENWTQTQRDEFAQILNGGFSTGTMGVNLISPPVFELEDNDVYVVLRGANLNLHPTNRKIEILDASDNSILAEVPVGQIQTYTEGTQLIFYYNFNSLGDGEYKLKITNGAATYITTLNFQIVAEVTNLDLSENTFDLITSYTNTASSANENTITYASETTTDTSLPVFSAKSDELFAMGDDWYLEVMVNVSHASTSSSAQESRIGVGYSSTANQLVFSQLNYMAIFASFISPSTSWRKKLLGSSAGAISATYSDSVIFIKQGNLLTVISGTQIYSQTISNNSGYSLFLQIPGRAISETYTAQIVKAYKFN